MRPHLLFLLLLASCVTPPVAQEIATAADTPSSPAPHHTIVAFGDSITAGAGVPVNETYPAHLQRLLRANGTNATVINMGVPGDTTAMALERLDAVLAARPDIVIVALGANDAAQLTDPAITESNLRIIITTLQAKNVTIILAGGPVVSIPQWDFPQRFTAIYPRLGAEHDVEYIPSFLQEVIGDVTRNLDDRVHPNSAGNERIARNALPHVQQAMDQRAPRDR